jgi:hypothetical protein
MNSLAGNSDNPPALSVLTARLKDVPEIGGSQLFLPRDVREPTVAPLALLLTGSCDSTYTIEQKSSYTI